MVRAPCCEKMGLKKGPWTPEEDQILVAYIQGYGHGNWRALPKQAGLLRCGKSCRLRWTNYLRPDIKRGNFTREEEETIIKLHELLGNRWSAIAARLPGRTDNEIKNVWHTHLKKRLTSKHIPGAGAGAGRHRQSFDNGEYGAAVSSPPQEYSSSDASSTVTAENCSNRVEVLHATTGDGLPATELDENLWSEALSGSTPEVFSGSTPTTSELPTQHQLYEFPIYTDVQEPTSVYEHDELYVNDENLDFWYNILVQSSELPELPDF